MGRAYYRFGHDIALRLSNGQAFALRQAELGAIFINDAAPICFLRGNFTAATYRALVMRGVIPPNRELQTLAQPVDVQLNLQAELVGSIAPDATTLTQWGRRLDQNSLTDAMARKLLTFDVWRLVSITPWGQHTVAVQDASASQQVNEAQDQRLAQLVSELTADLWSGVEEHIAGDNAILQLPLDESVKLFFDDLGWQWEEMDDVEGLLRTAYQGQNSSWMCYTRILDGLNQVIFYSVCPVPVQKAALSNLCEYICRINAELSLGNFEIDFEQLSVRFRTSIDVTDVGLTPWLFRNLVYQNLAVMDLYLPEMMGIMVEALPITI